MIKIGLCGLGTVGKSFVEHIDESYNLIKNKIGIDFEITAIADRSIKNKKYKDGINITEDAMSLVNIKDIDVIVELIGNVDLSYDLLKQSIKNKKHVITANKALIAKHGGELFSLASKHNIFIGFEASVAGAIPIIQTISANFSNERITSIAGIINGTSNFILHKMSNSNCDLQFALTEAQKLGYAEADPSFDINGTDAAHKISILAALAFGIKPPLEQTDIEGIESITNMDISYTKELGYIIKHVGVTEISDDVVTVSVHPVLVANNNIFSQVPNEMNAIVVKGERFGQTMLYGHGAGGNATASAVISDLVSAINFINYSKSSYTQMVETVGKKSYDIGSIENTQSQYYLRISADDVPGVMAEITNKLAEKEISIEAVTQHEPTDASSPIPIVIITNNVRHLLIKKVIKDIEKMENIKDKVYSIRILGND
tara:strand:+ start:16419 stop:17711 length:1293 start_codon:yes stop_codon:yes gene_type:complete